MLSLVNSNRIARAARTLGAALLLGACTLPDVKIGGNRKPDAGRDEQATKESEAKTTDERRPEDGGAPEARAANGGKASKPSAGAGGKGAGESGTNRADAAAGDAGAEPEINAPERKWSAPSALDLGAETVNGRNNAIDDQGRAIVLWEKVESGDNNTYAMRYVDSKWTSPIRVAGPSGLVIFQGTALALDPSGQAIALTMSKTKPSMPPNDGGTVELSSLLDLLTSDVYATRMSADGKWGTGQLLGPKYVSGLPLAVSETGAAIVAGVMVEAAEGMSTWTLWASRYAPDSGWAETQTLVKLAATQEDTAAHRADAADWPIGVALAIDRKGRGTVAWVRDRGVYATGIPADGLKALDEFGTDVTGGDVAIGSDDYGRSIALWTRNEKMRTSLYSRRFISGAGWDSITPLESNADYDTKTPSLTVDKKGNAMAVWSQSDGTTSVIWYNRYEIGNGWSGAQRVEPKKTESNAQLPQIAMDGTGNVLAIWSDLGVIRASRYVVGRGWDPSVRVSQEDKMAVAPVLGVSPSGAGVVTWQTDPGAYWFSRFQ